MTNQQTIGLLWDVYNSAVEGQIVRDICALQSAAGNQSLELHVFSDEAAHSIVKSLGALPNGVEQLATIWIIYRTTDQDFKRAPDDIDQSNIIERDLYMEKGGFSLSSDGGRGYFLKPQGRIITNQMENLIAPNPSGQTNPMLILLWGSVSKRLGLSDTI